MPPPPPPPPLPEEIVEEILLRFPPLEPAWLVRAALVCKQWCRLVSARSFRRRLSEFHRTPPMLGFLCNILTTSRGDRDVTARFVPTSASWAPLADRRRCYALDARHGRVLFRFRGRQGCSVRKDALAVWDPVTDELRKLPVPARLGQDWFAAVVCAGSTCDHLGCHHGPFPIVLLGIHGEVFICTYSSDAAAWSEPVTYHHPPYCFGYSPDSPCAFVGNALYFSGFTMTNKALKFDLQLRQISWIDLPTACSDRRNVLATAESGGLGLAAIHGSKLCMWLRNGLPQVDAGWTQSRVNALETLLPADAILVPPHVIGFADGVGNIFIRANNVLYTIDINTYKVKKVYNGTVIYTVVPYLSFYTPGTDSLGFWFCNTRHEECSYCEHEIDLDDRPNPPIIVNFL